MRRVYHPWHEWECFRAGFYETSPPGTIDSEEAANAYSTFLRDIPGFERAMARVAKEWPKSCEHFLTNDRINRVAWLGQAAMCIETGVPSIFRHGFKRLLDSEMTAANTAAGNFLLKWLSERQDS